MTLFCSVIFAQEPRFLDQAYLTRIIVVAQYHTDVDHTFIQLSLAT